MAVRPFPSEPRSAGAARRFLREELAAAGVSAPDAELLLSELASNAIRHARTSFEVEVVVTGDLLRVGVSDTSPDDLTLRATEADAASGRGLQIVGALAGRWGVRRTPAGKQVYFEQPVRPAPRAGSRP